MVEALRDPVWQFVGVVLAVLSLGAAFWIYWMQCQTKELAFGLVSSRRPLAIADELSARVTVQLDGRPVGNLHLLVYGLKNSGRQAIVPTDFECPLSVVFAHGQVVSAEVASQIPGNLGAQLTISAAKIELAPLLLNPGDQLLVQVLLSSTEPSSTVDARIRDVSSFAPIDASPRLPPFFESGLSMLMVTMLIIGVAIFFLSGQREFAYPFLGFAAFISAFAFISRLLRDTGESARRRITEA